MRELFYGLLALFLLSGCGKYFDEENVVGAGYAQTKAQKRDVFARTVTLAPGAGLDSAFSGITKDPWRADGQCRTGVSREHAACVGCGNAHHSQYDAVRRSRDRPGWPNRRRSG